MKLTRRWMMVYGTAATGAAVAGTAFSPTPVATAAKEIWWEDLIPPGVPYAEIIGEGEMDFANDTWLPIFDAYATKLNETLDGVRIRMPGFVLPLEFGPDGVTEFVLVPYVGACVHVPPPPPNQLVFVTSETPWPSDELWEPVWVTGILTTEFQTTDVAETGYALAAVEIEPYIWEET